MGNPISILLIGNLDRPEFQGVRESLESFGEIFHILEAETAIRASSKGEIVADLTLIVQSYPGELSQQTIDRLREAAPLSRIVALLGSWCEGEQRSGHPWPTVLRSYWHQGFDRMEREILRFAEGDCPNWGLPLTATEEERLLAEFPAHRIDFPRTERGGLIGIATKRFESFDWLSDACRQRGYATLWLRGPSYPRVAGFNAILIEGSDFRGAENETFQEISARYPQSRRIAVLDFPRVEDRHRLLSDGATAVLSKPLCVNNLFAELER